MEGPASAQITATRLYSIEEYLRLEEHAIEKSEYKNGKIINMAGGTVPHNVISANFIREIGNTIIDQNKPCVVASGDMKIYMPAYRFFNYSDGVVFCGEPEFHNNSKDSLTNPTLIVEVSSDSTEVYDRTDKFDEYCSLDSFQEYVIASQKQMRVEVWTKQEGEKWVVQFYNKTKNKIKLHSIDCELDINRVYYGIVLKNIENRPPSVI
jgi:Uma2 family endonuclease